MIEKPWCLPEEDGFIFQSVSSQDFLPLMTSQGVHPLDCSFGILIYIRFVKSGFVKMSG